MILNPEIIGNLTIALHDLIQPRYGPNARVVNPEPVIEIRPWSVMLDYKIVDRDGILVDVLIKIPREDYMTTLEEIMADRSLYDYARNESVILTKIEETIASSNFRELTAIPSIGFLPEFCAVVMERQHIHPFKRRYLNSVLGLGPTPESQRSFFLAGRWLRLFHDTFDGQRNDYIRNLEIGQLIEDKITEISKIIGDEKRIAFIRDEFQATYDCVKDLQVPVVMLHDDLNWNNVYINEEGKVGGFDPSFETYDAIYRDFARIITDPLVWGIQVLSQGWLINKDFHIKFVDSFFAGYSYGEIDEQILYFYCSERVLGRWLTFEEKVSNFKYARFNPVRRFGIYLVRKYCQSLLDRFLEVC